MENKKFQRIIAYLPAFSFSLTYIIYLYLTSGIAANVSPWQIARAITFIFLILAACSFAARKLAKDDSRAGLAVWVAAELLLVTQKFFIFSLLISACVILLWVGVLYLRKNKFQISHISFLLSLLGFCLTIGLLVKSVPWDLYLRRMPKFNEAPAASLIVPDMPKDIYLIVLDGYVRPDVMKEIYGFDNSGFVNYLLDKNFIIPKDNYANYSATTLSVGSILNMQYIQTIMPGAEGLPFGWLMTPVIKNNQVKALLEAVGYRSVAIAVDWELTNIDTADIYLKPLPIQINDYEKLLFQSSPLKIFSSAVEKLMILKTYPSHRRSIDFAFESLRNVADLGSPKFVFAHIMAPHPPFVYDKDGQPVQPSYSFSMKDGNEFPGTREQYINGYVGQMQFINRQLENVIGSILERSKNPPIIVLLSDHGSRMLTDFLSLENSCIRESYSNFAAFYLPDLDSDVVPSDITPVNTFRLIFDQYFGTELGMLDNQYAFSNYVYQFKDIAGSLDDKCELSQ